MCIPVSESFFFLAIPIEIEYDCYMSNDLGAPDGATISTALAIYKI